MNDPAISPPASSQAEASTTNRLALLERRVLALEGHIFKRGDLGSAVRRIVDRWPGPFTSSQIRDALYESRPDLKPITEHHQVCLIISRMEKSRAVIRTFQGAGPTPNIYERAQGKPLEGKAGGRFNASHASESGFRGLVRLALKDLPAEFTLADVRAWIAANAPQAVIPYGSWSSTLYKLQGSGELKVLRGGGRTKGSALKVYARGPRQIAPSGDELADLEKSWQEFRASLNIKRPVELMPTLLRQEEVA